MPRSGQFTPGHGTLGCQACVEIPAQRPPQTSPLEPVAYLSTCLALVMIYDIDFEPVFASQINLPLMLMGD